MPKSAQNRRKFLIKMATITTEYGKLSSNKTRTVYLRIRSGKTEKRINTQVKVLRCEWLPLWYRPYWKRMRQDNVHLAITLPTIDKKREKNDAFYVNICRNIWIIRKKFPSLHRSFLAVPEAIQTIRCFFAHKRTHHTHPICKNLRSHNSITQLSTHCVDILWNDRLTHLRNHQTSSIKHLTPLKKSKVNR